MSSVTSHCATESGSASSGSPTRARAVRRHVAAARVRVGLAEDAEPDSVAQWLVTELIAPPTRALQLHLFGITRNRD